ncbi:hypothetical protein PT974_03389 [Cladobotryum mycophilum]|uniref:Uncharacterized protein n=1 Tax=Cladobotryum mycophilum TaxID=491253 RepID=A0ABR0SSG9_9HYPO
MKNLWILITLYVATFLPVALSYGERDAAERSKNLTQPTLSLSHRDAKVIGSPNLALNEDSGDIKRPTELHTSTEILDEPAYSFNHLFGEINRANFDTGKPVTGNIDSNKLMPGVGDYYDVLARMGDPTEKLSEVAVDYKKRVPDFSMGKLMR